VQSVPSILASAIPTPPKRTIELPQATEKSLSIPASETVLLGKRLDALRGHRHAFIQATHAPQMAAIVVAYAHSHAEERIAVLAPTVRDAQAIHQYLASLGSVVLTGEETDGQRHEAWQMIRSKRARIFIGTRLASLLLPLDLDTVFVLRSGHDSLKQEDQNPRYDAREQVLRWQASSAARVYFLDLFPRADDLVRFSPAHLVFHSAPVEATFVDLRRERAMSPHPRISYTAANAIEQCLSVGRRVLCLYNRTGRARALRCADCGHEFPCARCGGRYAVQDMTVRCHHCQLIEPIPLSCPTCGGTNLSELGFGVDAIRDALQTLHPNTEVGVAESSKVDALNAPILVCTSHYAESIAEPFGRDRQIGLVLVADADLPLYQPSFRSLERAVLEVATAVGYASACRAACIIQSFVPDLLRNALTDPETFLEDELKLRQEYGFPPYARRMRLVSRADDGRRGTIELESVAADLKAIPGVRASLTRSAPERPAMLQLTVPGGAIEAVLARLRELPDHVIIDTNAIS